ncbi:unnamed protein product [Allacma fusca]|uniref:Major facilitator superfamily (MFS) profile domain-containing protein n=1 Tax=Allacma fusca TaxID=39272 RepID=A0A8J2L7T1_9HEXA|nr:unnamed protein product [Allacma fusca]
MAMEKRSPEIGGTGGSCINLGFYAENLQKEKHDNVFCTKISKLESQKALSTGSAPKRKTRKSTQIFAAFAANMGAFALGSVLSWTATGLPSLRASGELGHLDGSEDTWIGSIATLGAVAACPFAGYGITNFGRRMTMLLLTVPFLGGWLLIFFAQDFAMIYAGRFLTGFCGGAFTIAAPVFIAESADVKIRGGLASGFDLMVSVGMLYIYAIGAYTSWHTQALCCGLIPIVFHILMCFVPESPRYLIEIGDHGKATKALSWLYGMDETEVQDDLKKLIQSVEESKARPVTFRKIIMKMSVLKPIVVCLGLMLFTTMSGYDAVTFYTVDIFQSAGTNIDPRQSTIILGAIQVIATIPAAFIVDKYGRRLLLMISEIFMCISLAALGAYFYMKRDDICSSCNHISLGWLPLTSLTVFLIAYSVGIGPLSLMMIGELLPSHIKGLASCAVLSFRWMLGFAVTKLFEDIEQDLGRDGCYWLFSVACFLGCFFVYFCMPETKGKSLDEIQRFFVSPAKLQQERQEEEIEQTGA